MSCIKIRLPKSGPFSLQREEDRGRHLSGPWILADAGLLQGKKATASETDHIKSKGAIVSEDAVVKDGMIITANGPLPLWSSQRR